MAHARMFMTQMHAKRGPRLPPIPGAGSRSRKARAASHSPQARRANGTYPAGWSRNRPVGHPSLLTARAGASASLGSANDLAAVGVPHQALAALLPQPPDLAGDLGVRPLNDPQVPSRPPACRVRATAATPLPAGAGQSGGGVPAAEVADRLPFRPRPAGLHTWWASRRQPASVPSLCAAGTPAVAARQVNPLMPAATSRMRAIVCLQLSPRIRHPPLL